MTLPALPSAATLTISQIAEAGKQIVEWSATVDDAADPTPPRRVAGRPRPTAGAGVVKAFRSYSPESQCHGKVPYATKRSAKVAARHVERRLGRLYVYHGGHCGAFHLGHRPAPWDFDALSAQ